MAVAFTPRRTADWRRKNWKTWTSSWPSTCPFSCRIPVSGTAIRLARLSVTPPTPSPMRPETTLVWRKSGRSLYSTTR